MKTITTQILRDLKKNCKNDTCNQHGPVGDICRGIDLFGSCPRIEKIRNRLYEQSSDNWISVPSLWDDDDIEKIAKMLILIDLGVLK